jgi:hypothetical protein
VTHPVLLLAAAIFLAPLSVQATALMGSWGGKHISLELTPQGGVIELDCAHGTLSRAVVPDPDGRFDVPGTYVEERGGPVREGNRASGIDVRYAGRITAATMRLFITRTDTKARLGTFSLTRSGDPLVVKCR